MSGQTRDDTDCCLPHLTTIYLGMNLHFWPRSNQLGYFQNSPNYDLKDMNLLPSTMTFELFNFLPVFS